VGFVGSRVKVGSKRLAAKICVLSIFPVIDEMIDFASVYMADFAEHKPCMHV